MSIFILDGNAVDLDVATRGLVTPGSPPVVRTSAVGVDRVGGTWAWLWRIPYLTRAEYEWFTQTVCGGELAITATGETRLLTRDKEWVDFGSAVIYAPRFDYFENNLFWGVEVRVELVGLAQQAAVLLGTVSDLAAVAVGENEIDLSWTDAANEEGYKVERSATGVGAWVEIDDIAADETSYADTGLSAGETWYYRIQPYRTGESGLYSNVASAQTDYDLTEPSDLAAVAASSSQIDLTWTDTASGETAWKVERSPNGTTGWTQIASLAADSSDYSDTGLSDGTPYWYRVRPTLGALDGAYSNVATAYTDPVVVGDWKSGGYTILDSCGSSVGNTPDRNFDGDTALQWTHAVNETHFLDVDLGKIYTISHIRRWKISGGQYNWTNARLYISNDPDSWGAAVLTFTTSTTSNAWSEHALSSPVDGRYFRLEVDTTGIANNVACGELQLRV